GHARWSRLRARLEAARDGDDVAVAGGDGVGVDLAGLGDEGVGVGVALGEVGEDEAAHAGVAGDRGGLDGGEVAVVVGEVGVVVEVGRVALENAGAAGQTDGDLADAGVTHDGELLAWARQAHVLEADGAAVGLGRALGDQLADLRAAHAG